MKFIKNHRYYSILSLFLCLSLYNTNLLLSQHAHVFKHVAERESINQNWTIIDNPITNNDPDKLLFVCHDYGTGPYVNSPLGVWYTKGKWSIFKQDKKPLSANAKFNVLVKSKNDTDVFVHKAQNNNISGHVTTIDNSKINNNPNAILIVTQNWSTTGPYNNNPIGVYYYKGKWRIYNQNKVKMPLNAKFNVLITFKNSFRHEVTANTMQMSHVTKLNHHLTNKNPKALVFVTQYWTKVYNDNPVGLWYSNGKWTVYNENKAKLPLNAKFNVAVFGGNNIIECFNFGTNDVGFQGKIVEKQNLTRFTGLCTEIGETREEKTIIRNFAPPDHQITEAALVVSTNRLWEIGKVITVSMDDAASAGLKKKIMNIANEWTKYANVKFLQVGGGGDIHIKFDQNGGYSSLIGNQSKDFLTRIGYDIASKGTMNLAVNDDTNDDLLKRVVLHEFGHALGFHHEHQNPSVQIPWNKEAVYETYRKRNGWDRSKVDHNVFRKLDAGQTQYSSFDRNSIMAYSIPNNLTIGDFSIPYNKGLSKMDKSFASVFYPFPNTKGNRIRATITTGRDDLRDKSNANLIIKYFSPKDKLKTIQYSLNRGERWDTYSTHVKDVPLPQGVGINDLVSITLFFASEKRIIFDEDDSWRVDKLKFEFVDFSENSFPLTKELSGNPYIDFVGKRNPYLEFTFN